jgi:ferredoxin
MMVVLEDLKKEVAKVLKEGKIKAVIGYKRGMDPSTSFPVFIENVDEVENLIWDPTCIHNLTRYLLDEKRNRARQKEPDERPLGLIVKGCDSRAVNVLLQEKFINRDDVYLIGVSCEHAGVIDEKKLRQKLDGKPVKKIEFSEADKIIVTTGDGKMEIPGAEILAGRCIECRFNVPLVYDVLLGEKVNRKVADPYHSLDRVESLSMDERWNFWQGNFEKCIRCYACRSVCPMCYCDECVVDSINMAVTAETTAEEKAQKTKWVERSPLISENFVYHLVRAIHLAGRCIDCAECERVCPQEIPIRFLNKKLEKEAKLLFDHDAGMDADQTPLISCFKDEDPEDFIR